MKKYIQMPIVLLIFTAFIGFQLQAQTYIKYNPIPNVVGVLNLGVETAIGKKTTFSFDIMTSPWDYKGDPRKFIFFVPEVRYHFKENYNGFYVGGHAAFTLFDAQKWTYKELGIKHKGFGYILGATIGYQLPISNKWNLDFFVGGGWQQGYYHAYYIETGERYENAEHWNISGDWYLYRGGVMVSYKL
jgi:hypothetical protein